MIFLYVIFMCSIMCNSLCVINRKQNRDFSFQIGHFHYFNTLNYKLVFNNKLTFQPETLPDDFTVLTQATINSKRNCR